VALTRLQDMESMSHVCQLLAESGGEFYSDPAECSEVQELELL